MSFLESLLLLTGCTVALGILITLSRSLGLVTTVLTAGLGLLLARDALLLLAALCFLMTLGAGRQLMPNRRPSRTLDHFDRLRQMTQNAFAVAMVVIAIQYGLYAMQMEAGSVWLTRPSVVDIYLPVTAGISLRAWVEQGVLDHQHPAALVMFLALMASALVTKRAFCSWICAVGFISELIYRRGHKAVKSGIRIPNWLDSGLRMTKYGVLIWLLTLVLEIPSIELASYLDSDKHLMADLSMWKQFTHPNVVMMVLLAMLLLLSVVKRNAFCRYFCPYGALMGALSLLSPFKIRRDRATCLRESEGKDCSKCHQACPSQIPVHRLDTVNVDECHACHRCAQACPQKGALTLSLPGRYLPLKPSVILFMLLMFVAVVPLLSYLSGYWQSSTPEQIRQSILPQLETLTLLPEAE
ncbi:4Fe-4S binding protein [Ferrimonas sp. YFM]|uniref:4Fe-4S binding protein n=1 Tax=Ferrimonas sp. YFM TaxID=3028878 RepID=UPI00257343F1|nr:4Fe-4S binding protein [Ferrimonas sp. YFM]BDY03046.1 iron-sulfur cluster-binding protein [Ferrimonas sp. YFM]